LAKHIALGKKVGVIDLTLGQLGSRGTTALRLKESAAAAKILGLTLRENMGLEDGFFLNDAETRLKVIQLLRKYRPKIVLCNAPFDRHPDHGRAAQLISDACFYSGLSKIESQDSGQIQTAFRPHALYHYIQDEDIKPDFVIDVSPYMSKKMEAIAAFSSQFFVKSSTQNPNNTDEPTTLISTKEFLDFIEGRARHFGRMIFKEFGEGFVAQRPIEVGDLLKIID
jgi:bacillithiol biosynthesis deacetylase BshB1